MIYEYDNKKIAEFIRGEKMSARKAKIALNMSNVKALNGWMSGGDLRTSNLLHFVNTFGLNLLDFFKADGVRLSELIPDSEARPATFHAKFSKTDQPEAAYNTSNTKENTNESQSEAPQHMKEMFELREQHLKEMFTKEKELLLREIHNEKLIRQEYEIKLEAAVSKIEESYDRKLNAKDELIEELRQQLIELTLQCKELENSKKKERDEGK